ncbi:SMC-Scp complex subunit ScpB [Desertibacillus haloalkaliphilus]|uniref:SMC-Scp complex subunit ScpB n=1 Tax=Desertibacillus haloalkaliphilus TaxID=1328930 RepID=UPI001FE4E809|nr:SMC-Scp complex subunit ScpB [Desertibacillus haloalkaliphilus]
MKSIIEGLLYVTGDEGIDCKQLSDVLEVKVDTVKEVIDDLMATYQDDNRGIQIIEVGGSFQFTTKPEHAHYFKRLAHTPSHSSLSQAALETLAIIAYKQPITRVEIEEVRGVKTEKPLQTLLAKTLIKEVGRAEGTGRAILYGTTKDFLDYFGLKSIKELPPLPEALDDGTIEDEADLFFEKFEENMSSSS